jgi:hypothetical protein
VEAQQYDRGLAVAKPVGAFVNAILYGLWDLGFEVGHAVRTVSECVRYAQDDQAVKTGLLDARLLRGPEKNFQELKYAIDHELLSGKGSDQLIAQKLDEASKRRERFGNTIYLLEPNVKASEGGLRELHTALWIARARWHAFGVKDLLRVGAILPIVLAPVVVGLFWRTLVLAPDVGLVDMVTRALGLGSHNWLGDPQLALVSVIAIHTWQWTPFAFLVLLASLATLPPDVYEAARLDRAGAWQRLVHITLPLIRPAVAMVVILRTMTALSAFASRAG